MELQQQLETSAASGDADARFALGLALLSSGATAEGARGVSLIEAASAQGHAQATEKLAVFECMGVARSQSWARALDLLQLAAERGSASAQAQLLLLGDNEVDLAAPAEAGPELWRDLRARIDVQQRLQLGERRSLSDAPWIRVFDGLARAAECRWLIDAARDRLKPATVFTGESETLAHSGARTNRAVEFQLADMDVVIETVRARISAATRLPLPFFEPTQVLHYSVGQEFSPHHDFLDPQKRAYRAQLARLGQRIATVLIYLNEDYEGGETSFPAAGLSYRGRTGEAMFLANVDRQGRPDPTTLHAGLPPTSGEKWVLSQWIRDRAPASEPGPDVSS